MAAHVRLAVLAGFLAVAAALTGCGRQVAVTPASLAPKECARIVSVLPDTVDGAGQRPTTPQSPVTAAWGEPPIVLRCGVERPQAYTPTSVLLEIDGLGWLAEPLEAGTVFTLVSWPAAAAANADAPMPYVEVIIPEAYSSPGGVIADISASISAAISAAISRDQGPT